MADHVEDDKRIFQEGMNKKGDQKGLPLSQSPFNYAVSYWLKHARGVPHGARATSLSKELWELVRDLFWEHDGGVFMQWLRVMTAEGQDWHWKPITSHMFANTCLNPHYGKSHVTSIGVAASYGLVDIFEWAHPDGIDFDIFDDYWGSPLMQAAWSGEEDVVKVLLSRFSGDINRTTCRASATVECSNGYCALNGSTVLMKAAASKRSEVIKLLLKQPNIEVDLVSHGNTALGLAISENFPEIIELLLGAGAKLAMKNGEIVEIPSNL
jgi:ankyrin repeat protein